MQLGWCPDLMDPRDYCAPNSVERPFRSPSQQRHLLIENESAFGVIDHEFAHATSAHVTLACIEWISRYRRGISLNRSPGFLHLMSIRTNGGGGPLGIGLRSTIKTLIRFGAPPAELWKTSADVRDSRLNDPAFFAYASDFRGIEYHRLDYPSRGSESNLANIKCWIQSGKPCVCGFSVPQIIGSGPMIPIADRGGIIGGTAVLVMGFDDTVSSNAASKRIDGAFYVRCCWGQEWGDLGYGWLPYGYVLNGSASDFWAIDFCEDRES